MDKSNTDGYTKIKDLNMESKRWKITGRIMNKTPVKFFTSNGKKNKVFNTDINDATGEIRCVVFGSNVDKFYNNIELQKVYEICNGGIRKVNKNFNSLNHDFEILLTDNTSINELKENAKIPKLDFNFMKIKNISETKKNELIDVVAIIKNIGAIKIWISNNGTQKKRKEIVFIDDSNSKISLILWDSEQIDTFVGEIGDSIIIKNARVADYFGARNLSIIHSSVVLINNEQNEEKKLKKWYEKKGKKLDENQFEKISNDDGKIGYEFKTFYAIYNSPTNETIDVIAKIDGLNEVEDITSSYGQNYKKKEIILIDNGNNKLTLNLWNEKIDEFQGLKNEIIVIKNAKIGEYNYVKNLSLTSSSVVHIDPNIPEVEKFKNETEPTYNFDEKLYKKITEVSNMENQSLFNMLAVIHDIGEIDPVFSKDGRRYDKREITLMDDSNEMITLTLWNDQARNFTGEVASVIKIERGRINEYNNSNYVSLTQSSVITYNAIYNDEGFKKWYQNTYSEKYNKEKCSRADDAKPSTST